MLKRLVTKLTEAEFERYVRPTLPYKISGRNNKVPQYLIVNQTKKYLLCGIYNATSSIITHN